MKKFNELYESIVNYAKDSENTNVITDKVGRTLIDLSTANGKKFLNVFDKYDCTNPVRIEMRSPYWALVETKTQTTICNFKHIEKGDRKWDGLAEHVISNYKKWDNAFKKVDIKNIVEETPDKLTKLLSDKIVNCEFTSGGIKKLYK